MATDWENKKGNEEITSWLVTAATPKGQAVSAVCTHTHTHPLHVLSSAHIMSMTFTFTYVETDLLYTY